jgi:hypothetical protein
MKRLIPSIFFLASILALSLLVRGDMAVVSAQSSCALQTATSAITFCDTFDAPAGTGTRAGDLNGTLWGVSRLTGDTNLNARLDAWPPTQLIGCNGTSTVLPPQDVAICNGQVREASNDNASGAWEAGTVTVLAMYPKQPFDWAGRTGTVGFDVSNDSHGTHAAWPEFWITDKPVPAPFTHFATWQTLPQYGLGLRFGGHTDSTGQQAGCPEAPDSTYLGIDSAIVINNYVENDTANNGTLLVQGIDCVKAATQVGQMNHYEVKVSQSQIDVYGTDAGTTSPLKHLATIPSANLGFTRGLIWIEDVHYNADKADPNNPAYSQRQHTFAWDNVAFDGPFTYRDLSYDALDNISLNSDGSQNLAKASDANQAATWNVLGMPSGPTADAVRVLFNFYGFTEPNVLNVTVNGHAHPTPWPYPDAQGYMWRTYAVSIPISDLVPGTNVVQLGGDQPLLTANVNIVLVNGGGSGQAPVAPSAPSALHIMFGLNFFKSYLHI